MPDPTVRIRLPAVSRPAMYDGTSYDDPLLRSSVPATPAVFRPASADRVAEPRIAAPGGPTGVFRRATGGAFRKG